MRPAKCPEDDEKPYRDDALPSDAEDDEESGSAARTDEEAVSMVFLFPEFVVLTLWLLLHSVRERNKNKWTNG